MDQLVMSGLFPAGSKEGEEERPGGGKPKGRDASTGAVYAGVGVIRGSLLLSLSGCDRKRVLPLNDWNSVLLTVRGLAEALLNSFYRGLEVFRRCHMCSFHDQSTRLLTCCGRISSETCMWERRRCSRGSDRPTPSVVHFSQQHRPLSFSWQLFSVHRSSHHGCITCTCDGCHGGEACLSARVFC